MIIKSGPGHIIFVLQLPRTMMHEIFAAIDVPLVIINEQSWSHASVRPPGLSASLCYVNTDHLPGPSESRRRRRVQGREGKENGDLSQLLFLLFVRQRSKEMILTLF